MARSKPASGRATGGSSQAAKRPSSSSTPPPTTWDERLVNGALAHRREISGIILFLFALLTLLALIGLTETGWLGWWTRFLRQLLGWGAFALCFLLAGIGMQMSLREADRPLPIRPPQVIGLEIALIASLALTRLISGSTLAEAFLGRGGGLVGWGLTEPLLDFLGPLLTTLLYLSLFLWGIAMLLGLRWATVLSRLEMLSARLNEWAERIEPDPTQRSRRQVKAAQSTLRRLPPPTGMPLRAPAEATADDLLIINEATSEPRLRQRDKRLPPIDILEEETAFGLSHEEIDWKSQRIEQTLHDFGVPAKVTEIRRGPAVTQFGVEPGYIERAGPDGEVKPHKVRVGQIAALQKDLTLALAAPRLRIEAPVPGRSVVGIEVPNESTSLVRLRPIIESRPFFKLNAPLAVGLGRDVSGAPVTVDLSKLPHLLVAGTTGSGKSVCINAFVTCLVLNNTPDKLRLVMIDPKKVEFIRFNGLPHLIGKVEVDADRAVGVLRWLTAEMDRRYELFAQASARNLGGYNRKAGRGKHLPHILVFIDELADLMHTYPGDVERTLCRLAQMARATGIHLVVATQRPSTDVITGLIKANFPARLSFAVASGTDSRVILDTVGAEHLLGKGDMLFLAPDASGPARIQGVFVTDNEIERVAQHWRDAMPDYVPEPAPWESLIAKYALLDETDSLLEAAVELAQKHDNISTSFLQRRLRLGYPRAARLMQHLEEMGLVDDAQAGGKTRRTLVDEDDDPIDRFLSERD